MAIKKKVPAKKEATAPKKRAGAKKRSPKTLVPDSQETLEIKSTDPEESYTQDEDNQPITPPVYTTTKPSQKDSKAEDRNNSMLKYLVLAALILVGVIAYSVFSKKEKSTPEKSGPVNPTSIQKSPDSSIDPTTKKQSGETAAIGKDSVTTDKEIPTSSPAMKSSPLKGFALSQMVDNKNHAEATEYCKSIGMKLPRAEEMKKINPANVPSDLKTAVVWVADVSGGRNLRYVFQTNKNQFTDSKTKLKVLCKE